MAREMHDGSMLGYVISRVIVVEDVVFGNGRLG